MIEYRKDQELPGLAVEWYDGVTGALVDFSTGYTFTAKVCARSAPAVVLVSKTTGITGAATAPNLVVDWSTSDFSTLDANPTDYVVHLYARRTADTKDRVFRPGNPIVFKLHPAPAVAP